MFTWTGMARIHVYSVSVRSHYRVTIRQKRFKTDDELVSFESSPRIGHAADTVMLKANSENLTRTVAFGQFGFARFPFSFFV